MSEKKYKRIPKPKDFVPEPYFPEGHRWAGEPRCQAWSKQKGRQCLNKPKEGSGTTKCRSHGGKTKRGPEAHAWKHGAYEGRVNKSATPHYEGIAKTRWRSAYLRFLESAEALTLTPDIALNGARIEEQITALGNTVTYEFLDSLDEISQQAKEALQDSDAQATAIAIAAIIKLSQQARADLIGQDRLDKLVNQRQSLVGQEQRSIEKQERHMAIGAVVALMLRTFTAVCDVIAENTDEPIANRIFDQSRLALQTSLIYLGAETMLDGETEQNGRLE